jgi:hypothetical protein
MQKKSSQRFVRLIIPASRFVIVDSERSNVAYGEYEGQKLERRMLTLRQRC